MVMTNLPESLWKASPLESVKNVVTMKSEVEHVYGNLSNLDHIVQTELPEAQGKNWKLMLDPFVKAKDKGATKVIRYGGRLEGADELPAVIKDPRFFPVSRQKEMSLKMPKFKYDKWSVGTPPMKSIFIYGLNDNVNQEFLTGLFEPLGQIDQLKVYYHPKTRKHLGIAFVSFSSPSVTKEVLAKWHGTSIMGNIVNIKPDPLCQITKKVLDKLIRGPVANIPEIIQSVEIRSQHKTAAYAFRHNERSQNYYTARGKVRRESETEGRVSESDGRGEHHKDQQEEELERSVEERGVEREELKLEQVSPKMDTPPDTEISPIRPEEDMLVEEQFRTLEQAHPVSVKQEPEPHNEREPPHTPPDPQPPHLAAQETEVLVETKYKVPEILSPPERHEDRRRDARLYEMDRERRKAHSDRKYEEWKMKNEMQIRADKTSRYVKEHCSGARTPSSDKYPTPECGADKYLTDKHKEKYSSKEYRHLSERERYYAAYYKDKYHSRGERSSGEHRYIDEKHRGGKYDKYKYDADKYKYYGGYHRHSDHKGGTRSSSKDLDKIHKLSKAGVKDYEKYENVYHRESPRPDFVMSPLDKMKREVTPDPHLRLREDDHLVERASKRKRSKSPLYQNSPLPDAKMLSPKPKVEQCRSPTSHDTGYNSISPAPVSPAPPPRPEPDISLLSENPYGCGRAVPRKHISKVKLIGLKSEGLDDMSSSSMSLDEESVKEEEEEEDMRVEDISPNNTPQQPLALLPTPTALPLLPLPTAPPPLHPLPPVPVNFQTGQWLHTSYPEMYQYDYQYNPPEEAADILARREVEQKAETKRLEQELNKERKGVSLEVLLHLMETILKKDIKINLNEKVAFTQLEDVWNQEEDRKKREEEDMAAKRKEEMANLTEQPPNKAPDMPTLSEMRNISDAKQSSHIRQANLSFKVPKLNRGLRAQVIVKKMPLPLKQDSAAESEEEEEDVDEAELVTKRRELGSRYNKIYSSSSSSSSESEEEAVEEVQDNKMETLQITPETTFLPTPASKYSARFEEEDILVMEQLFREDLVEEDKGFFKTAYDLLMKEQPELLDGVTWVSPPEIPHCGRRRQPSSDVKHRTGCARTEGYYRMSKQEKIALKQSFNTNGLPTEHVPDVAAVVAPAKKSVGRTSARSTRALQRRQATHFLDVPLVQFMQLTTRRKQVKFQRSDIHDWGLFAQEAISADEMVIEYVGEVVREIIANIRERIYEKEGIGSSYLFRIDQSSYIVDATHKGSISRFINHNCDPNCYARVINVGIKKKIVIYSKRDIDANEEITYDYKFAIEEEANKIPCLCKSPACRGFLN